MDLFRVRLNCLDHYQATSTRYDPQLRNDIHPSQAAKGPKVPVVRAFGSTETGQKVCAHIHGAFPYLYVEYSGSLDQEEVGAYIYRLHLSIDHALAVSYRRDQYSGNAKYVARITLVKGIPFYGFHVGYKFFLKIYMFSPVLMTRLADLLQQGVIMKRKFQPYEAHLQYLLQFMTDYNLYGCGFLDAANVRFRAPVPLSSEEGNSQHLWHDRSIPRDRVVDDFYLPRVSRCSIEVDICVQDIMNRRMVKERRLHQDFVERIKPLPSDMKLVYSMAGLWKDETRRRKLKMPNAAPGSSPFPAEVLVSMSADVRQSGLPGWIHEEEYREELQQLIDAERDPDDLSQPEFDTFVERHPLENTVKTALESVEDLFPVNLMPALGLSAQTPDENPSSSIEVDEQKIVNDDSDYGFFPEDSDEEWLRAINTLPKVAEAESKTLQKTVPQAPKANKQPAAGFGAQKQDAGSRAKPSTTDVSGTEYSVVPETEPIIGPFQGVCVSRLTTGQPHNVPFPEELFEQAEEDDLVSRRRGPRRSKSDKSSTKRRASPSAFEVEAKRQNLGHGNTQADPQREAQSLDQKSILPPSSQRRQSDRRLSATQARHSLGFPVVKSQDDPTTKLRLSQKDSDMYSSSGSPEKRVTFHPAVTFTDGTTSTSSTAGDIEPPSSFPEASDSSMQMMSAMDALEAVSGGKDFLMVGTLPPSIEDVSTTFCSLQIPDVLYQDAYYSKESDVPKRSREYAGKEFRLKGNTLPFLPEFNMTGAAQERGKSRAAKPSALGKSPGNRKRTRASFRSWEIAKPPPSYQAVEEWWEKKQAAQKATPGRASKSFPSPTAQRQLSQIDGPTPKNSHGFKYSQKNKSSGVKHEIQYMSTMSLEVHVNTRGTLVPNPDEDEVQCIFWSIKADGSISTSQEAPGSMIAGIVVRSPDGNLAKRMRRQTTVEVIEETEELDLFVRMVEIVRTHDPDVLTGYEVHGSSWGYMIERARVKYDYDLCDEFSRMKSNSHGRIGKDNDRWGFNTTSTIRVTGRHMINVWRAMRGELNLLQYTMENVVWHLLHRRIPHYSWKTLTSWYNSSRHRDLDKLLRYYLIRTKLDIEIMESNELIPRTSEQARLLGVDFFSVFSRGSQYKVESIMFRIAKPENFLLVSPTRQQVGGQNALECLPLVMEPQSAFYNSPVLVLDFQSLYPSVMIAYNLCYSTFLGRITSWKGMNKMGFTEYRRHQRLLELLKDHINITPNGMMYAKAEIRKSLLAKMLGEILETRVMVKSGMKQDKDDKALQQLLNNRQLALKLLANVTYGYTSASFSGRMPCSEIADSIVQTARETLERAIAFIHSQERWNAEVVYGDTDSLFIHLKGRTKDQAFDIGNEIAEAITDMNPRPIKLKFEKVYLPCVLLAKKRYVGYKYESRDQVKPEFDAKGIETVRRDGTPAEQKIEEKALRLLFETADLSRVKAYFQAQCGKIMRGAVSIQDFCFAKEVKLGSYSDKGPPPPGALISTRRMLEDARAEPQYGERVPYVVITGAPGARLIDRCVAPETLLRDAHSQLDAEYYISKNLIPPLERIFNLVGANVRLWYDEMPKVRRVRRIAPQAAGARRTLESYMRSASCVVCGIKMRRGGKGGVCRRCRADAVGSMLALQGRVNREARSHAELVAMCRSCAALAPMDDVDCDSKDCPVFYSRLKQGARLAGERGVLEPVIRELGAKAARAALEW